MVDPVILLLVLGLGLPSTACLGTAVGEVLMLRARARLATAASHLPAGAELGGSLKGGTMWVIRIHAAAPAEGKNHRDH